MTKEVGAKAQIPNPALKLLEPLIGEWHTTGTHPYFPDAELHGRASFEWIEGGAFLRMRSEINHPKFPDGVAIFGSDDEAKAYYQIYYDERGISRKYDIAVTGNQITLWRDDDHFSQRFTMTIEDDRLVSAGEMSRDGGDWETDLSLTYTRQKVSS
jgi:hypothetical protein